MGYVHEHPSTTVVEEDRSATSLLAIVLILGLVALLIWFIGFSGLVLNRTSPSPTRVENNRTDNNTVINPPANTTDNTTGGTSGGTTTNP